MFRYRATPNHQIVKYAYDQNSNLTGIDYPNMPDVAMSYDNLDDVTQIVDGVGTHSFTYDNIGRLTALDGPFTDDQQTFTYDSLQRLQTQTVGRGASGGTQSQSYAYDALGRLSSLTSNGTQGVGAFNYHYAGLTDMLTQLDLPNGTQTTQSYDGLERLTQVVNKTNAGATLNAFAYAYDNRDVRTGVQQQYGTDPLRQVNYSYDNVDQLVGEAATGGVAGSNYSNAFTYDAMGNRLKTDGVAGTNTSDVKSSVNGLNQLTSVSSTVNGAAPLTSGLSYDVAGNLTGTTNADGSRTIYNYDDADRLYRVERHDANDVPLSKTEFIYDYASRNAISRDYSWTAGAWVQTGEKRRVFNGMNVVQERNAQNQVTAQLVRTGNIGGILSRSTSAGVSFYGYDGGGNVTLLTDANGNDVGHYRYDAFGNTLEATGSRAGENPYRFSTKEYDSTSGLYDYGLRFYSPGLGRWINRDPIREDGGVNLYQMVYNNPVNALDSYGLDVLMNVSDFASGWGDTLSFGGTKIARRYVGEWTGVGDANEVVDYCSGWYKGGEVVGTAHSIAFGAAGAAKVGVAKGAAEGGDILANTYRLGSPAARAGVRAFNRAAYDEFVAVGGRIVRKRGEQLLMNGGKINGYYDQANKLIVLGKGSNLGTLTEELIHSRQAIEAGGTVASNMKNLAEIQAHKQLVRLGFIYR